MRGIVSLPRAFTMVVAVLFLLSLSGSAMAQSLTIMHTNDMHSHLLGYGPNGEYTPLTTGDDATVGGLARIAGKVNDIRASRDPDPTLLVDGVEYKGSGVGNGPIDSALSAVRDVVKGFADITLEKFSMKAITGGTDAVADVTVAVRRGDRMVTASSVNGDTVMARVEAIIKGMNRLLTKSNHVVE